MHEVGLLQTSAQIVSTQSLSPEMGARYRLLGKQAVAPCRLALLLTKAGDVESNPGPTTHTPVIWMCDHCHKQINKKQASIRCNHTHNTHCVHLNCTPIKQRPYKPDWRYTIHTPTQNVTTTPITDNTTPHHTQTTTHPLTNNNQPKDKNIVMLQININGIRNKVEELKNLVHSTQSDVITMQETKLTQKAKHLRYPTTHTTIGKTEHKQVGGLITLIKDDITFTNMNIPKAINTELQLIKIHIGKTKDITVANAYFPPRDTTSPHHNTVDTDIACYIRHLTNIPDTILTHRRP